MGLLGAGAAIAQQGPLWVNDDENGSNSCQNAQYSTIAGALDDAGNGATVRVCPGIYTPTDTLTVGNGVTLKGPNPRTPGTGDRGKEATIKAEDPEDRSDRAPAVVLREGADLVGMSVSSHGDSEAVSVRDVTSKSVVRNNVIAHDGDRGALDVITSGTAEVVIKQNLIEGASNGVFLGRDLTDTTVTIIGNTFDGPGLESKAAIKYLGDHPLRVSKNTFKEYKNAVLLQPGSGTDTPAPVITVNNFTKVVYGVWSQLGRQGTATVDATKNWWGSPSGPQQYPEGKPEDGVAAVRVQSGSVEYMPWLCHPFTGQDVLNVSENGNCLGPIEEHYREIGGKDSVLGAPLDDKVEPVEGTQGRVQKYEHGRIYYSDDTGAHEVYGAILGKYLAHGGATGFLGFPTSGEHNTDSEQVPGRVNTFAGTGGAAIYWSPDTGAHTVRGAIYDRYTSLGGPSFLGLPVTDELVTPDGFGRYNHFAAKGGASIYWTPLTGAHEIYGLIRDKWAAMGWERSPLGYPTSGEQDVPNAPGRYNTFAGSGGGAIYWSLDTGAHAVYGAIYDRYQQVGGAGFLGLPTTDETSTPDGIGRYNHFAAKGGASIYWTPSTGAHEIYGAIRDTWASLGWERSRLGYPVTGEYSIPGGRANQFQGGTIHWDASSGRTNVIYY